MVSKKKKKKKNDFFFFFFFFFFFSFFSLLNHCQSFVNMWLIPYVDSIKHRIKNYIKKCMSLGLPHLWFFSCAVGNKWVIKWNCPKAWIQALAIYFQAIYSFILALLPPPPPTQCDIKSCNTVFHTHKMSCMFSSSLSNRDASVQPPGQFHMRKCQISVTTDLLNDQTEDRTWNVGQI